MLIRPKRQLGGLDFSSNFLEKPFNLALIPQVFHQLTRGILFLFSYPTPNLLTT
jgi:hypothetical protein